MQKEHFKILINTFLNDCTNFKKFLKLSVILKNWKIVLLLSVIFIILPFIPFIILFIYFYKNIINTYFSY